MNRWLTVHFVQPLIIFLASEWKVSALLTEQQSTQEIIQYVQRSFATLPFTLKRVIEFFCFLFLLSARLFFFQSFSSMKTEVAIQLIHRWRHSRWPGCAQLIQLFENLIALPLFARVEADETN